MAGQHFTFSKQIISWLLVISLLGSLPANYVEAAYDHPVTWNDMSELNLGSVLQSPYASATNLLNPSVTGSVMDLVLRDGDNRISSSFKVPADLNSTVEFWLNVYTQYTTQHVVIFDARHPEIVYVVLDFRELSKKARNAAAYEIMMERKIDATLAAYKRAFERLTRNSRPKNPSPEEKSILAALAKQNHKHSLRELADNLRTQAGQRDNVMKGLLAAESFFPKMEELFRGLRVPAELTRLALVESSFNLHAYSRVGAAGVWQFMLNPGSKFLKIDSSLKIDERLSPLKSTVAAAKLLRENYTRFRSWPLAVTSYNHGLRGLPRLPKKNHGEHEFRKIASLFKGCNRDSPLGWAGRNYYAEFLAVLHAEAYRHLFYGEPPVKPMRPIVFHSMTERKPGLKIAMENAVSLQEFRFLNPDIRDLRKPLPKGFQIALPGERDDLTMLLPSKSRPRPLRAANPSALARR